MAKKVLVVDDSMIVRRVLSRRLQDGGFEVLEASQGSDGIASLQSHTDIAFVLCDYNMPGMNGVELLRKARNAGLPQPFVFISSEADPLIVKRAQDLGASGWVVKPISQVDLLALAEKLCGR